MRKRLTEWKVTLWPIRGYLLAIALLTAWGVYEWFYPTDMSGLQDEWLNPRPMSPTQVMVAVLVSLGAIIYFAWKSPEKPRGQPQ